MSGGLLPNLDLSVPVSLFGSCDISRLWYERGVDRKPDSPPAPTRPRDGTRPLVRRDVPQVGPELRASLEARRELGPEYEGELVEGFLERLDQAIDARVDSRLEQRRAAAPPAKGGMDGGRLALGIVTTALGVPLTAIVTNSAHGSAALVVVIWVAIVLVNLAAALGRRR